MIPFLLDGKDVRAEPGQTILEAAEAAGIWIPRLCHLEGLEPFAGCRVCTVKANGRLVASCAQPAAPGMVVLTKTPELVDLRKRIVEMLLVTGNHFCMVCEKSGSCELQALAYRLGIAAPRFPYLFPSRGVDATHPSVLIDHDRCILCARCVRASRDLDGKAVFQFVSRGAAKRVAVDPDARLSPGAADRALDVCPVGALLEKRRGYRTPIGRRKYDAAPIGTDVEKEGER